MYACAKHTHTHTHTRLNNSGPYIYAQSATWFHQDLPRPCTQSIGGHAQPQVDDARWPTRILAWLGQNRFVRSRRGQIYLGHWPALVRTFGIHVARLNEYVYGIAEMCSGSGLKFRWIYFQPDMRICPFYSFSFSLCLGTGLLKTICHQRCTSVTWTKRTTHTPGSSCSPPKRSVRVLEPKALARNNICHK